MTGRPLSSKIRPEIELPRRSRKLISSSIAPPPEIDRRASLEQLTQAELSAHVIGRRRPKFVGSRGQLAELVIACVVGEGDTLVGSFESAQNDERALERQTAGRVRDEPTDRGGGNDVTRDRCGFDWGLTW